jgi:hypothetical protein
MPTIAPLTYPRYQPISPSSSFPSTITAGSTKPTLGITSSTSPSAPTFFLPAVVTPQNCPIVHTPAEAAAIVYNEVGALRATTTQSATQLQAAKNFMAGVTLKNSNVATSTLSRPTNLSSGGYMTAGQLALQQCQINPERQFVIWPSNNGRTPNPGINAQWPYASAPTKVFGPFYLPVQVGDVPAGTNIYVFGY